MTRFVCVIMTTNILGLATTLKYLGAKWLPEKKLILRPRRGGGGEKMVGGQAGEKESRWLGWWAE